MQGEELKGLREHLLEIIEDRLITQGYRAMSVDDIASAAGISKKTLYEIFKSKEDMTAPVVNRVLARLEAEIAKMADIGDPLDRFCQEELAIIEILTPIDRIKEAKKPGVWAPIERFRRQRRQYLRDLFEEAQEKGLIRSGIRPELIALMYDASMKALVDDENRVLYSILLRAAGEKALEVFLEGLRPR